MNDLLPMEGPQDPDMLSMSSLSRKSTKRISSKHSSKVKPLSLKDFTLKTTLGKGAFGKVILAEKISTKELFAIKVVEKEVIIEGDDVEITQLERNILALGWECRFLTCLHAAFQTTERLFYVMEFLGGGDLMHHMIQCRRFSEERSKFYTAE